LTNSLPVPNGTLLGSFLGVFLLEGSSARPIYTPNSPLQFLSMIPTRACFCLRSKRDPGSRHQSLHSAHGALPLGPSPNRPGGRLGRPHLGRFGRPGVLYHK
jgi:hypothetical protein